MKPAGRQDVHPEAVQHKAAATEVEIKIFCKSRDERVENLFEIGKGRVAVR
jgi:hypothetical protein